QYPWGAPPVPPGPPPGGKRVPGGLVATVLVAALVAGGIGGGIGFFAADSEESGSTTITSGSDPEALNRSPKSVAGIAGKTLPSVVTIETKGGGEEGTGTGFVFDKQGHILTNNHVVASGGAGGGLSATFSDGKKYEAEVVGKAQGYDVAVIKLKNADGHKLAPLPLGKSDDVRVGDATIAIGAPFGLSGTVTTGIVSAKNRPVASSDGQGSNASYMNALQTDASINPGNSGGPLLNAQGAVIGVNSAIQSAGGEGGLGQGQSGSIGLGFAIPVNQAKRVATQLIKTGTPVYPVIGATVTMDQKGGGAVIAEKGEGDDQQPITKNGPADKAGLKPGDVITRLDDTPIDSGPTLIGTIWTHKPGEKVKITYKRDGKEATTEVTLGSRKGDQ
uniref:S1C family serine protease n=1 Tax=Streptomyces albidus (ex Kaewkla and Franco 2022) TaxID=722709 RepID=UPI0015EF561F